MKEFLEFVLLYFTVGTASVMTLVIGYNIFKMVELAMKRMNGTVKAHAYILIQHSNKTDLFAAIIVFMMAAAGTLALLQ